MEQVLGRYSIAIAHSFRMLFRPPQVNIADLKNQSYATDQVISLNDKIKHASTNLQSRTTAHLKLVDKPENPTQSKGKGKSPKSYTGVEDEQTELSKAAKDRYVYGSDGC